MPSLRRRIEELDAARNALLDELERLPRQQLAAHPIQGKWSILEIVEHLVLAEKDVLAGLPDPAELRPMTRTPKDRVLYWVVMGILRFRVGVKTPSKAMEPKGATSLAELRLRWDQSQAWLRRYADSVEPNGSDAAVFRHPVAGPMTLEQTLRMARTHVSLHTEQIQRLRSISRTA